MVQYKLRSKILIGRYISPYRENKNTHFFFYKTPLIPPCIYYIYQTWMKPKPVKLPQEVSAGKRSLSIIHVIVVYAPVSMGQVLLCHSRLSCPPDAFVPQGQSCFQLNFTDSLYYYNIQLLYCNYYLVVIWRPAEYGDGSGLGSRESGTFCDISFKLASHSIKVLYWII